MVGVPMDEYVALRSMKRECDRLHALVQQLGDALETVQNGTGWWSREPNLYLADLQKADAALATFRSYQEAQGD
jgi:hypothetical protein